MCWLLRGYKWQLPLHRFEYFYGPQGLDDSKEVLSRDNYVVVRVQCWIKCYRYPTTGVWYPDARVSIINVGIVLGGGKMGNRYPSLASIWVEARFMRV